MCIRLHALHACLVGDGAWTGLVSPAPQLGAVADAASAPLAEVREKRAANRTLLRSTTEEWARKLHERGAAESRNTTLMRDRFCVGIRVRRVCGLAPRCA